MHWRRRLAVAVLSLGAGLLAGCASVGYYRQAIAGQWEVLSKRQSIDGLLEAPSTEAPLRRRLELVKEIRQFAAKELHLPVDGQYSQYADLGRRYVVWNVHAAPQFSLEPHSWWYPIVGELTYRGYFHEAAAQRSAARLESKGFDVYVEGVEAYSTLGWFKDPVLNTFIHNEDNELAETLFHELAHQEVFASGDTDFSEAFATAVGEEGVRRWLRSKTDTALLASYQAELRRHREFVALVMAGRQQLLEIYDRAGTSTPPPPVPASPDRKGAQDLLGSRPNSKPGQLAPETRQMLGKKKGMIVADLRESYTRLKRSWGGYPGYDHWFSRSLNNAQLNTVATYHHLLPAFERLLQDNGGDLRRFYRAVDKLARLPEPQRQERIAALLIPRGQPLADSTMPAAP